MIRYTRAADNMPQITWLFHAQGDLLYYKYAVCQPDDNFCKKAGKEIAESKQGGCVPLCRSDYVRCVMEQMIPQTQRDKRLIEAVHTIWRNE